MKQHQQELFNEIFPSQISTFHKKIILYEES